MYRHYNNMNRNSYRSTGNAQQKMSASAVPAAVQSARPASADHGPEPYVLNIEVATLRNPNYRTAIWTGENLQATLMSIPAGESIGLELHADHDQFLRIEAGQGLTQMGPTQEHLMYEQVVHNGDAIFVPAGMWHNVTNTGHTPLKLYSIYAPAQHPWGTVHHTKAEAEAAEQK